MVEFELEKILWAVDAFPDNPEIAAQAGRAVRALNAAVGAIVEPVYVTQKEELGFITPTTLDEPMMRKTAKEHLEKFVKQVGIPKSSLPKSIPQEGNSTRSAVKALVDYAVDNDFDLIAVGTHARKGVARFFLGSFAETLVLHSPIPVLVCSPRAATMKQVKHLVFPTDFSDKALDVYERTLSLAKKLKADVFLFHQLEYLYPQMVYPFVVPPVSETSVLAMEASMKAHGERWVAIAKQSGVKAKFMLSRRGTQDVASRISKAAEKLPSSLIVMASESGPAQVVLLGSVTRQVIRISARPVMVIHSRREEARLEAPSRRENETRTSYLI